MMDCTRQSLELRHLARMAVHMQMIGLSLSLFPFCDKQLQKRDMITGVAFAISCHIDSHEKYSSAA